LGNARSIVYIAPGYSAKSFKGRGKLAGEYIHRFGSGVKIYTTETGKSLIVMGGKFRVTDWLRG